MTSCLSYFRDVSTKGSEDPPHLTQFFEHSSTTRPHKNLLEILEFFLRPKISLKVSPKNTTKRNENCFAHQNELPFQESRHGNFCASKNSSNQLKYFVESIGDVINLRFRGNPALQLFQLRRSASPNPRGNLIERACEARVITNYTIRTHDDNAPPRSKKNSKAGNRTRVSCVTGRNTNHFPKT